jgi:UDP-N-acetylmuramoyl-tripeptide--D-alanyl-D-alanine ligase
MRELGAASPALHREAGIFTAKTGKVDWVIGVEGNAEQIVEGAVSAGLPRAHTRFFASSDEAAKFLEEFITTGDMLLVKGSRGVKMERIVEALLTRYAAAGEAPRQEVRH